MSVPVRPDEPAKKNKVAATLSIRKPWVSTMGHSGHSSHDMHNRSFPSPKPLRKKISPIMAKQFEKTFEMESLDVKLLTQPVAETADELLKEVDSHLMELDTQARRKKELLHKRWTERVWMPLQQRVKEKASLINSEIRRNMMARYIHYCNAKGFVFLDIYHPEEYDPFEKVKLLEPTFIG